MPFFHCQTLKGFDVCGGTGTIAYRGGFQQKRKINSDQQLEDFEHEQRSNLQSKRPCLWPSQESQDQRNFLSSSNQNFQHFSQAQSSPVEPLIRSDPNLEPHRAGPQSDESNLPLPRNMASNNLAEHFLSCIRQKNLSQEVDNYAGNNNCQLNTSESRVEQMEEEMFPLAGCQSQNEPQTYQNANLRDSHIISSCCNEEVMDSTAMDSDFVPDSTQYVVASHIPASPAQNIHTSGSNKQCHYTSCRGLKSSPVSGRLHCHCSASWRGMYGIEKGYTNDYY